MISFHDLSRVQVELGPELRAATERVVRSGRYLFGPELEAFEQEWAEYCGAKFCVGVAHGTDAITIALLAAGCKAGETAFVPAFTALPTGSGVVRAGLKPAFVDVTADGLLDVSLLPAPPDRIAVPVHLYGGRCPPVTGKVVVEDCAHFHGMRPNAASTAAAWSFYPTKNLGALGDAGAITTDHAELASRACLFRHYGFAADTGGMNSRMSEIQAAVLRTKLPYLALWNRRRSEIAAHYDSFGLPRVGTAHHLYVIRTEDRAGFGERLSALGVASGIHYSPTVPAAMGHDDRGFPVALDLAASVVSLPFYPQMTDDEIDHIAQTARAVL